MDHEAITPTDQQGARPEGRIVSLVEWHAPSLTPDAARRLAEETGRAFRRVPGLLEARFFGDFETGRHFYFQVWEDQAALDAYTQSEAMFRNRDLAAPYVAGRPSRLLLADYTADGRPSG